jgi:hypothetical protein
MIDRFESLENGEVISVQHDTQVLSGHRTFRVGELNDAIKSHLASSISGWSEDKNGWFSTQGIDCEALRFGSNGWQKGRIRLCLEFCPDEPTPLAQNVSSSSISTPVNATTELTANTVSSPVTMPSSPAMMLDVQNENSGLQSPLEEALPTTFTTPTTAPEVTPIIHENVTAIPVAVAAAVATAAVAVDLATPDRIEANIDEAIPHLTDTVLEPEEHHVDLNAPHSGGLDEIAFDFDVANNDRGRMIPNGLMELDLNDLGLDFSEHDLLSFEANGMSDAAEEFINLQDLSKPENSGMLIDEVWNEMNQGNWPGIN